LASINEFIVVVEKESNDNQIMIDFSVDFIQTIFF